MAERRMFAKSIVLSDAFLDMPMSARCLYFTLNMLADDDGFINSPKSIMRQCGASEDDMRVLIAKHFCIAFETGVIVIKHWRINNYLRSDRYKESLCKAEKAMLTSSESGEYQERYTTGIPTGIPSIGKDRIGKDRIDTLSNESVGSKAATKHTFGEYGKVKLTSDEHDKLVSKMGEAECKRYIDIVDEYIARTGRKYKSHYLVLLKAQRERWSSSASSNPAYEHTSAYSNEALSAFDIDLT